MPREVPLEQLTDVEVAGLGVGSATDLLTQLKPRTASSMSTDDPIVLVNGRVAGSTELDNLPSEAILRVDILPEKSALRYGFDDTQKVVNLVLRERYRGGNVSLLDRQSTEGGGRSSAFTGNGTRIGHDAEATVRLDYRDNQSVLESQRGLHNPDSAQRTLLPDSQEIKLGVTGVQPILSLRPSLEASVDLKSSDFLQGLTQEGPPAVLEQHNGSTTLHVGSRLTGPIGRLVWSLNVTGDETRTRQRLQAGDGPVLDRSRSTLDSSRLDASLGGPVLHLPAGPAQISLRLNVQLDSLRSEAGGSPGPSQQTHLSRTTRSLQGTARLPLTSPEQDLLAFLGEISARVSLGASQVPQVGTLTSYTYGLTWRPREHISFNADLNEQRLAPSVQDLQGPLVSTPNVQIFDFVTGQTLYVTQLNGGNPDLRSSGRRTARIGLYLGNFAGNNNVYANYEYRRDRDLTGPLPPLTLAVQSAFPGRFIRDATGTLVTLDNRPVNLAMQYRDAVTWGFNLALPFTAGEGRGPPPGLRLSLSLQGTWFLHDTLEVRSGLPRLDRLNGAPSGGGGNGVQPRHTLQLWANFNYRALGAQLGGRWTSASFVDEAGGQELHFSALGTLNLRVFTDAGQLLHRNQGWARDLRLSLEVNNLLDARQQVRDSEGITPIGFAPGHVDPIGRALNLNVRKAF